MEILSKDILSEVIHPRKTDSHKGTYGRVALIGGNEQYGGAIIMSSMAAVYSGSGLVTTITHKANHIALHSQLPEAMVVDWEDLDFIEHLLPTFNVIVIGPGLGLENHSIKLLQLVLQQILPEQLLIIDGSAIDLLAEEGALLTYPENIIYTPHQKEWERLSGIPIHRQSIENNLLVQQTMEKIVVLKRHHTEIYLADGTVWKLPIGTPAMATGGMGDTLAGMIASFVGQFDNPEKAVLAAVYLHSSIADSFAKNQYVVLPTQITKAIPKFMKKYEKTTFN